MVHMLSHGDAAGEAPKSTKAKPAVTHRLGEETTHRFWCGDAYLEYEVRVATGTAAWGVSATTPAVCCACYCPCHLRCFMYHLSADPNPDSVQQTRQKAAMDMLHTVTPESMRGIGVAGTLCDAAFLHAKTEGYGVVPSCSYIRDRYLPKHTEYHHLVVNHADSQPKR